jgi:hypothetical protein
MGKAKVVTGVVTKRKPKQVPWSQRFFGTIKGRESKIRKAAYAINGNKKK